VSDNLEGFFGCGKEEFMKHGLFWQEIMHIEDGAGIVKQMQEVISNNGRGEFFYRITTPIGETKMLLEKITVATDENGMADKVYIVKSDYTHIENAEQSLIESERKFRFISENITDFISIIDNDGKFLYTSPSAQNVIGYDPDELIGENTIYIIHPNDVEVFIESALEKAVFEKKESQIRYRILSKTGKYRWVETYYKPIIDAMGSTTSIICSTRDVTEREQLMKDLEQALEKERELNELRSKFVSTASHQFRTPLTVIHSGVELMEMYLDDVPPAKQKPFQKQFNRIQNEVARLQDLMNDVLLLGRADVSRTPFNPEEKDLVAFCKDLIETRYNSRFNQTRKVVLNVSGKTQKVSFDPKLLDHALENILSNAYKYSSQGNIDMLLKFDYENVTIAITDKGIGIPENDLANLFQPFYRAGNTIEIEGTGLGLSIVKEFIDKHGGQIFVMSELNKGTTVSVILPLKGTTPQKTN
jgi:PAS domain S-box-containing protein